MRIKRICPCGDSIDLGVRGENEATQIVFDVGSWYADFGPGGVWELLNLRPEEETPYPVALTEDGDGVSWIVSDSDTEIEGTGSAELRYYIDGALAKSRLYSTLIHPGMVDSGPEPPEPEQGWVDQVLETAVRAENAARDAEDSSEEADASAQAATGSAQAAAGSAVSAGLSAEAAETHADHAAASSAAAELFAGDAAESARDAQTALQGMIYVTFGVSSDGHVIIRNGDLLGSTSFALIPTNAAQRAGHLEVEY